MRHFLLIDPIEKLNIKKDSTLMLALELKKSGVETYLLFEKDFFVSNTNSIPLYCHQFEGAYKEDGYYLNDFKISSSHKLKPQKGDVIHMRLDPPFDSRYLRILWMLDHYVSQGVKVINDPKGIAQYNEKLLAYRSKHAIPSFVGQNADAALEFISLHSDIEQWVMKPLDLYSGLGVEKVDRQNWRKLFDQKVFDYQGPIILQPYQASVEEGEHRAIFFRGKHLGTILKKPKTGEFISNIAQGASFEKDQLASSVFDECTQLAQELKAIGVDWIAYDVLGKAISEVNITCPGLLVEVSYAHHHNLAKEIVLELIKSP